MDTSRGISYENILQEFDMTANNYQELCQEIEALERVGRIKPNKSAGTNALHPPLYKKYFVCKKPQDKEQLVKEIKYDLALELLPSFYLKNIGNYRLERQAVLQLSDFFKNHKKQLDEEVAENVRSFQIWGDEKFLEKGRGKTIVAHCIDSSDEAAYLECLNIYQTNEPLNYFSISEKTPQNLLIVENLEPFYTIRKIFRDEGEEFILSQDISTIIYGAGNHIASSFQEYYNFPEYLRHKDNKIYYFGDLDYSGIKIYQALVNKYPDIVIEPFVPAYRLMLEKALKRGFDQLKEMKDGQVAGDDFSCFKQYFNQHDWSLMEQLWQDRRYIPQEILTKGDYVSKGV